MNDKEFDKYLESIRKVGAEIASDKESSLRFLYEVYSCNGMKPNDERAMEVKSSLESFLRKKKIDNILNDNNI